MNVTAVPSAEEVLAGSAASAAIKQAVLQLAAGRKPDPSSPVSANPGAPPVKVLRAILWLLESQPSLAVQRLAIHGHSGCSDFVGTISVNEGERHFRFHWDCKWKAEQLGWTDVFSLPDQGRAAREYGFRCMREFQEFSP